MDNTAVQDGYQLYHHTFIFTSKGDWAVIQQGMNASNKRARRYHWLGSQVEDFVNEPHNAICCDQREKQILNLVDRKSDDSRQTITSLSCAKPEEITKEYKKLILPPAIPFMRKISSPKIWNGSCSKHMNSSLPILKLSFPYQGLVLRPSAPFP